MEFKNATKMTNAEIRNYQEYLTNEYERVKRKIDQLLSELNEMDDEWVRVEVELNKRRNKIV